jgi:hypothetical protein
MYIKINEDISIDRYEGLWLVRVYDRTTIIPTNILGDYL